LNAAIFVGLAARGSGSGSSNVCDVSWLSAEWGSLQPVPETPLNPLAMAHLINHPPRGVPPNAAFHSVDVSCDIMRDSTLRWFVPCLLYKSQNARFAQEFQKSQVEGQTTTPSLPCLGVISTRNISEGEEVFCNYNFDADVAPDWYSAVE
jgi:hypothetical protein